ncbi:hypothetical protein H9Q72_003095 [Fusarium xylarioides]|uniref:Uncharacterized protein n=1 Tax=Fusarium xylarioides TaxID=221167 RepID=A0A9P7I7A4_9HYPO|nr:hypothetical protein H9Q72_003095 [Fusarium xylarioides]KAG5806804.1 hypothetical protein H9Q71_008625 [Fusarium xylarioides]KAG5820263.1 hypothetical protein H9Q74_008955 [Fusarium xylarioides]
MSRRGLALYLPLSKVTVSAGRFNQQCPSIWNILQGFYRRRLNNDVSGGIDEPKHLYRPFARTVASSQQASITYWTDSVRDYTYTPLDFPSDNLKASSAIHLNLEPSKLSLLQSKCRELGVTIKAALQLSWIKVLCESLYRQGDVVYGEVVSTDADDDVAIVGPVINTLPLRAKLGGPNGCINVSRALALVQKQIDSARGPNSMASLRKIQTLWRSGYEGADAPGALFQSLFVFDGVLGSSNTSDDSEKLFKSVQAEATDAAGPAYDDYPLIVSFHIRDNVLNGKLRAKLPQDRVESLGKSLSAALDHVIHGLDVPVVDTNCLKTVNSTPSRESKTNAKEPDMNGLTPAADAVLKLVETVVGTRRGGKKIGYNTRLINVGLDSILAIRLSKLLKQQLGLSVSVFEIMKGAGVRDISTRPASSRKPATNGTRHQPEPLRQDLKSAIAKTLGQPEHLIKSIVPALPGQRSHLELWLHNGKRFFEAPWVYRLPETFDQEQLADCWSELAKTHDVLRTTFVTGTTSTELYQVTLSEAWSARSRFIALQDSSKTVEELIAEHVSNENSKSSDLKEPLVRLSFLEAADGKAVVLRLHHALYDAWSIKMIERDLNDLLNGGKIQETPQSLEQAVRSIREIRQPEAEEAYWRGHLSAAQETVLGHNAEHTVLSALGPQFKISSTIAPQNSIKSLLQKSSSEVSAALILSYARTLQHFTQRTNPTFGLNHASRSLSSPDGTQTLDLTAASIPTLSVTPFSIDLELSTEELLGFIQDHLAQLNCFSQTDGARKLSPKFNSHLNIIHRRDHVSSQNGNSTDKPKALERYRLPEPLASDYFTATEPSSIVSTIDGLGIAHLPDHHFFFNVIVGESGDVNVSASGDKALFNGESAKVTMLVDYFLAELSNVSAREG